MVMSFYSQSLHFTVRVPGFRPFPSWVWRAVVHVRGTWRDTQSETGVTGTSTGRLPLLLDQIRKRFRHEGVTPILSDLFRQEVVVDCHLKLLVPKEGVRGEGGGLAKPPPTLTPTQSDPSPLSRYLFTLTVVRERDFAHWRVPGDP